MSIVVFLCLEHFLTEKNRTCLESNGTVVDNLNACKKAVNIVKKNEPTAKFVAVEDLAQWPKGCYLAYPSSVYFNNHSSGSNNEYAQQICNVKGKELYHYGTGFLLITEPSKRQPMFLRKY